MERKQFVYIGIIVAMYSLLTFTMGTGFIIPPWIATVMLIILTFFATMFVFKMVKTEESKNEEDTDGQK